jgi:putative transposase
MAENVEMRKRGPGRNPLFVKRWFSDDVIIMCVRWYLRFRLSYRDLASITAEFGIAVALSTILRWAHSLAPRQADCLRAVGFS